MDHVDVETGDLMLPIRNGLFEGRGSISCLGWRPSREKIERTVATEIPGYPTMTFRLGRYASGWCWYQVDPPCCPFGWDEYENMAWTLAYGYQPNWPDSLFNRERQQ